jgi:hypothetical protein
MANFAGARPAGNLILEREVPLRRRGQVSSALALQVATTESHAGPEEKDIFPRTITTPSRRGAGEVKGA